MRSQLHLAGISFLVFISFSTVSSSPQGIRRLSNTKRRNDTTELNKMPANLKLLHSARSSRQSPFSTRNEDDDNNNVAEPISLYGPPKEESSPSPILYGPPARLSSNEQDSVTMEAITEDSYEAEEASTSSPGESEDEVTESPEMSAEYLPPRRQSTALTPEYLPPRRDQQMIETNPALHQIQIHVVPPHLVKEHEANNLKQGYEGPQQYLPPVEQPVIPSRDYQIPPRKQDETINPQPQHYQQQLNENDGIGEYQQNFVQGYSSEYSPEQEINMIEQSQEREQNSFSYPDTESHAIPQAQQGGYDTQGTNHDGGEVGQEDAVIVQDPQHGLEVPQTQNDNQRQFEQSSEAGRGYSGSIIPSQPQLQGYQASFLPSISQQSNPVNSNRYHQINEAGYPRAQFDQQQSIVPSSQPLQPSSYDTLNSNTHRPEVPRVQTHQQQQQPVSSNQRYPIPQQQYGIDIPSPSSHSPFQPSSSPFSMGHFPQMESNSLSQSREEELEGLNGKIVDAALLERVHQIIEEHERQERSMRQSLQRSSEPSDINHNIVDQIAGYSTLPDFATRERPGLGLPSSIVGAVGVEYQRAILSHQFTQTDHTQPQQSISQNTRNLQGYGPPQPELISMKQPLRLIQAPQLGPQPQQFQRQQQESTPRPFYGVPLAPVIGLDSSENYKVMEDDGSYLQHLLQFSQNQYYDGSRNRRRRVARDRSINNYYSRSRNFVPLYVN